jgi:hypothetical protein
MSPITYIFDMSKYAKTPTSTNSAVNPMKNVISAIAELKNIYCLSISEF